jgi:hypothetical protein
MMRHKSGTQWPDDRGSIDTVFDSYRTCGGDEKCGFSGLASKPVVMVYQWFGLKTTTMIS